MRIQDFLKASLSKSESIGRSTGQHDRRWDRVYGALQAAVFSLEAFALHRQQRSDTAREFVPVLSIWEYSRVAYESVHEHFRCIHTRNFWPWNRISFSNTNFWKAIRALTSFGVLPVVFTHAETSTQFIRFCPIPTPLLEYAAYFS